MATPERSRYGNPLIHDRVGYNYKGQPLIPVGPIQLQTHGGEIRWRNIFLREIPRPQSESGKQ